ncbi:1-aminocyclopropane-1-carboxylate oxidase [Nymphaea colorata]|nr:1-aminocyclopropane-1-carboxylate oxidase [Nymphaea colorata]
MVIPVIDFSKLDGDDRHTTMVQIANGCEEWGFFQLVNHGISVELLQEVKRVCSEFYKMEREAKFKDSAPFKKLEDLMEGQDNGRNEVANGHDSVNKIEDMDWEDTIILLDNNEWPSKTHDFKKIMEEFRKEKKKLAEKLTEIMDENLGLEKGYIKRAFKGDDKEGCHPFFGTKVSHYPPCPQPDLVNGLRAHTDAGGVILLFQDDQVPGLQILKDGQWIDVQPLENSIVVNTGDQIEVISNGRYKSVWHRVVALEKGNRRSIASFYNPSASATIGPAPQLLKQKQVVEEAAYAAHDHGFEYPKFVFGDYMGVYVKEKFSPKEPRFLAVGSM